MSDSRLASEDELASEDVFIVEQSMDIEDIEQNGGSSHTTESFFQTSMSFPSDIVLTNVYYTHVSSLLNTPPEIPPRSPPPEQEVVRNNCSDVPATLTTDNSAPAPLVLQPGQVIFIQTTDGLIPLQVSMPAPTVVSLSSSSVVAISNFNSPSAPQKPPRYQPPPPPQTPTRSPPPAPQTPPRSPPPAPQTPPRSRDRASQRDRRGGKEPDCLGRATYMHQLLVTKENLCAAYLENKTMKEEIIKLKEENRTLKDELALVKIRMKYPPNPDFDYAATPKASPEDFV